MYSCRPQMMSKCSENETVAHKARHSASLMFSPHFEVTVTLYTLGDAADLVGTLDSSSKIQVQDLVRVNPLHPDISIDFLHNVLNKFPMVLTRRICLKIKSFLSW